MPDLPLITIVTTTFNSINTVRDTIESVLTQGYPRLEHLIVDGGSTDGTMDLVRSYPHLKWVSEKDRGHYDAMNKGVRMSTGDVICILNSDDCFTPGTLLKVGQAFATHPAWDALFGNLVFVDSHGKPIYARDEIPYNYNVLRYTGILYVNHQALFVRRSVHDRIGYYSDDKYVNCCDYDFILRLGRMGCRVGHLKERVVHYRYHDHGQSADMRIARNMLREVAIIRMENGVPGGLAGRILKFLYQVKRQLWKLVYNGRLDLVPGTVKLRSHMREKTQFTSNSDAQKL